MNRNFLIGLVVLLATALIAPHFLYPIFLMKVLCFALFAGAFNLLLGFGGLMSFGHAAFFGSAAYATAHSIKTWGLTPELGVLFGVAVASVLGAVFGWLAIRRRGIYFAMITLALAQMMYFMAVQADFTRGEDGIQDIPRGSLFGLFSIESTQAMYHFVLGVFVIGFLLIYRTINSPFGHVLAAIRENEQRTVSMGYNISRYKLLAFIISAAIAGLAGSVKVLVFQLASLTDIHWSMSGEAVLITLVGGIGTVFGPVIGALVIITLSIQLAPFGSSVTMVQGAVFIACVLLFRRGIVGEVDGFLEKLRSKRVPTVASSGSR